MTLTQRANRYSTTGYARFAGNNCVGEVFTRRGFYYREVR